MRLPLCILALAVSAWAADVDVPQPDAAAAPDSAQAQAAAPAPAPQTPAPADAAKPADATPPAPPPKYGGFVFSGLADGYFSLNFNHPIGDSNQLQNFNLNWGTPEMSLVKATVDKSDKMFGFHIDVGFGETMRLIHAGDVASIDHKGLRYVEQMYLIAKPNHLHGTEIDFGQFVTSAGAEVIEANSNWNYSRSLLFAWAIPYWHMGLRTSMPVTKTDTVGVQLVNGWNNIIHDTGGVTVGFTNALVLPKYTWNLNVYTGPSNSSAQNAYRNLVDATVLLTPNAKFNAYLNFDYGQNNDHLSNGLGDDTKSHWAGIALAAHQQVTGRNAVAGRFEYFDDIDGYATGTTQQLKEVTATYEYHWKVGLVSRAEYRGDWSNVPSFHKGATGMTDNQNTLTIGLIAIIAPSR